MNIKKLNSVFAIIVLFAFSSCSSKNPDSVLEKANTELKRQNDSLVKANTELKRQNDSLVKANNDLALFVTIDTPDSTMAKYVNIPDNVKTAWWEYQQTKRSIDNEYALFAGTETVIKDGMITSAEQEQKTSDAAAEKKYNEIEKAAQINFVKTSKDFLALVSNPENVDYFSPYLGSTDNYWSLSVSFRLSKGIETKEKMPDGMREMLAPLKAADSVKNQAKALSQQVFEAKKAAAEKQYDEALVPAAKIATEKTKAAYMQYLQKIK